MRCNRWWPLLGLMLAVAATAGCASMPRFTSLMPGKAVTAAQNLDSQLSFARLSERHGDTQTAERIYQAVLTKQPQNQLALHRLGVLAAKTSEHEKAAEHFQAAVQAGPPSAELLNDIGFNLFAMGRQQEAEAAYRQALAADPRNQAARNNLGLLLGETRRYDESLEEFRRAGQDEAAAQANLAYAQTQAGDTAAAKASYHRALELDSELKPAAEALVQLTRQSSPSGSAGAESNGAAAWHAEIKTLPELVQEGKTADFFESVIERRRGTGRTSSAASSSAFEGGVRQAAFRPQSDAADRQSPAVRSPRRAAPAGMFAGTKSGSSPRESVPGASSRGACDAGAKRVLASVFRFPAEAEATSPAEIHRRMSPDQAATAPVAQPTIRVSQDLPRTSQLADAETRPAARPSRWRRGTLHEPLRRPSPGIVSEAPSPPGSRTSPVVQAVAELAPAGALAPATAAPALFLSSGPATSVPNPWQTPTWSPDLGAALSAGGEPPAASPQAAPMPSGPLATLAP